MTWAMSSNGTANTSCSTNARRSAGVRLSSTTSRAEADRVGQHAPAARARWSPGSPTSGSGSQLPAAYSRRALRDRSMSRLIRPTTVVSQPAQVIDRAGVAAAEPQPGLLHRVLRPR